METSKAVERRKALPNPPPRNLNRVTRKLEDATRRFLNYLSYCMCARTRNMLEYQDWKYETSDELCALCAHYNTINYNRKRKGKGASPCK